jgi:rSAM/selenodomain-associated transferase 2
MPSISIIIPVLNEEATIGAVLAHLKELEDNCEVIVVDGGSDDATVDIAREHATVLTSQRGRAQQMNHGASVATGEIFLFLHADTLLPRRALSLIAEAMSQPSVVGGRFRVHLDGSRRVFRIVEGAINLRDRLFRGFTGDQAIFVRASVFRKLGGYRQVPLMEDLDLATRLCREGPVVRLSQAVTTSARRWEKDGVLRTVLRMWVLRYLYVLGVSPSVLKRFYSETR